MGNPKWLGDDAVIDGRIAIDRKPHAIASDCGWIDALIAKAAPHSSSPTCRARRTVWGSPRNTLCQLASEDLAWGYPHSINRKGLRTLCWPLAMNPGTETR